MILPEIPPQTTGRLSVLRTIWKYKFWIIFLLSVIPGIILSIQVAKQTSNYLYPIESLGISILGADTQLFNYIRILETNPQTLIGMTLPEVGIWDKIVYAFHVLKIVWLISGTLFLIFVPMFAIHKIIKWKNSSLQFRAWMLTLLWFSLYLIFMNMLLVIIGLVSGTIQMNFDSSWNTYTKITSILYQALPFHGIIELVKYIFTGLI